MSYTPVSIFTDCGNGYGVALVRDGDNAPVRAGVDLNATDGTATPRILINGTWTDVDEAFATAYRAMTSSRSLAGASRTEACRAANGGTDPVAEPGATPTPVPPADDHRSIWWMVVPSLAAGLSFSADQFAFNDLRLALPNDGLTMGILGVRTGADMIRTNSWVGFEPGLSDRDAIIADSLYGAVTAGMCIAGGIQSRGGDPALYFCMNGAGDIAAGRTHRHAGRGWGSLLQLGLGAIFIPVGFAAVGINRPTVSESDMYAPDGMAGARDVGGNPYEQRYPNLGLNMGIFGANQAFSGLVYGIYSLSTGRAPDASAPRPSVSPTAGGAMFNLTGTF